MNKHLLIIVSVLLFNLNVGAQTWQQKISNTTEYLMKIDFVNPDTGIIVGGAGTILRTTDGGENWNKIPVNFTNFLYGIRYVNDTLVFAVGDSATYYKSVNGGISWVKNTIPALLIDFFGLDFNSNGKGVIVGNNETILRTSNFGYTWELIRTDYWGNDNKAQILNDSTVFIFGTNAIPEPLITYSHNFCDSLLFRDFFPYYNGSLHLSFLQDACLKNADSGVFVGITEYGEGFVTNNMNYSVQGWDADLFPALFYSVDCRNQDCYIGGTNAVNNPYFLKSTNFGENWTEEILTDVNSSIQDVKFFGNFVFAVGSSGVILKKQINALNADDPGNSEPLTFSLNQNYPNPFNPTTNIKYSLKENVNVSMKIYNSLGQEVRTLVNEKQTPGFKQIMWDGKNNHGNTVPSGLYICRIAAGNYVKSNKMMLIK